MKVKEIVIAKDFSIAPAGRYLTDGNYSGERFRDEVLYPLLQENDSVVVNLDGTLGYGSSFLEEAFGGLIREKRMTLDGIRKKLRVISSRKLYQNRVESYLKDAEILASKNRK